MLGRLDFRGVYRNVWKIEDRLFHVHGGLGHPLAVESPDDELHVLAEQAAATIGLPLTVVETGDQGLERALAALVTGA